MKILFISSTRLGDAVLSTGLLDYLGTTYPKSEITVAAGTLGMGLFANFPCVKHTLIIEKQKYNKHWFELWQQTRGTKWDIIVDLRGSAVTYILRGKEKYIWNKKGKQGLHKVEQLAKMMGLHVPPSPTLYFSDELKKQAKDMLPQKAEKIIAVGPAANWIGKSWHTERFIELIERVRNEIPEYKNAHVAVFAAPGEEYLAQPVLDSIKDGKGIDFIAKTKPELAAALIAQCDLYIGNDSGLMHCAAASGIPTLGLFGPSQIQTYAPWGAHTHYVSTDETCDELIGYEGFNPDETKASLMDSLSVTRAFEGVQTLLLKQKNVA